MARAAIASYGGEFLPGSYDDWVLELREQLQRDCVDLCTIVCEAQERRGELAAAVSTARRRVALEPLEESGYRTLMELQADLGDRAGAVSTYHHCASVLERELGVIPDRRPETPCNDCSFRSSAKTPCRSRLRRIRRAGASVWRRRNSSARTA